MTREFLVPHLIDPDQIPYSRNIIIKSFSSRRPDRPIIRLQGQWLIDFAGFEPGMDVCVETMPGVVILRSFVYRENET